jgi:hypothetical protein
VDLDNYRFVGRGVTSIFRLRTRSVWEVKCQTVQRKPNTKVTKAEGVIVRRQ